MWILKIIIKITKLVRNHLPCQWIWKMFSLVPPGYSVNPQTSAYEEIIKKLNTNTEIQHNSERRNTKLCFYKEIESIRKTLDLT